MAHPYHHALSSVKKWGGTVDDYLGCHEFFDASKLILADFRHRALRHHAEGIFLLEQVHGKTLIPNPRSAASLSPPGSTRSGPSVSSSMRYATPSMTARRVLSAGGAGQGGDPQMADAWLLGRALARGRDGPVVP